ncbi:MAG TPA: DUF1778 domain-containing protein [Terracidiphilus sp.]|nr:DUF1778 domain-containing protein [Terracidiphilus sp.]
MGQALRTERTEARLLPEQKKRIERAAQIKGLSVSDFIVQHADEAAIRTIEQHATLRLSERNSRIFIESLLNPPEPGKRLKAAARRFRELTSQK